MKLIEHKLGTIALFLNFFSSIQHKVLYQLLLNITIKENLRKKLVLINYKKWQKIHCNF